MDQDKWIRKLARILTDMGFEDKGPATHRKYVYSGDRCTQECNLVIQSHAKETSKRAIVGYVKRTMRAAGVDPKMIAELDKLPLGFIAVGMKIDEIDDALFDALVSNDAELAAEIGIELGKQLKDPANKNFNPSAFDRLEKRKNNQKELYRHEKHCEDILTDIMSSALEAHINRHGYFEITCGQVSRQISEFEPDIVDQYELDIISCDANADEYILKSICKNEIADVLKDAGYSNFIEAVINNNTGDDFTSLYDSDDLVRTNLMRSSKATVSGTQKLAEQLDQIRTKIALSGR
ncbi:MAG: hypothetical protein EB015_12700 [Methylocystaceae bacterium]|nr:hypothetical protein [Methylocystaceae bacterium]